MWSVLKLAAAGCLGSQDAACMRASHPSGEGGGVIVIVVIIVIIILIIIVIVIIVS